MNFSKQEVRAELVNTSFGRRLAIVRKTKNFSQSNLGKAVGLSRASISNLESGIQNVYLYQVFAFAQTLNAPVSEFVPMLQDVVVHDGEDIHSDEVFLQVSKRQLIDGNPMGEDDENA